jgi:hypothetical protein
MLPGVIVVLVVFVSHDRTEPAIPGSLFSLVQVAGFDLSFS